MVGTAPTLIPSASCVAAVYMLCTSIGPTMCGTNLITSSLTCGHSSSSSLIAEYASAQSSCLRILRSWNSASCATILSSRASLVYATRGSLYTSTLSCTVPLGVDRHTSIRMIMSCIPELTPSFHFLCMSARILVFSPFMSTLDSTMSCAGSPCCRNMSHSFAKSTAFILPSSNTSSLSICHASRRCSALGEFSLQYSPMALVP